MFFKLAEILFGESYAPSHSPIESKETFNAESRFSPPEEEMILLEAEIHHKVLIGKVKTTQPIAQVECNKK